MPAGFSDLPPELHVRIALAAGTHSLLGRCSDLLALLATNRHFSALLGTRTNPLLWAHVFAAKFDADRIEDRLGPRWSEPQCLAAELRKRFAALDRIQQGDVCAPHARDDAWTAYLMLLEDDEKNGQQLLDGADIRRWVYSALAMRATLPPSAPGQPQCWLADHGSAALLTWLLWYVVDEDALDHESPRDRQTLLSLLSSTHIAGYLHPSFHAPDTHHLLPLCRAAAYAPSACGPLPASTTLVHYGRKLRVSYPVLGPAATLCVHARFQRSRRPQGPALAGAIPPSREVARGVGWAGPTVEDVSEYERVARVCSPGRAGGEEEEEYASERHDEDWSRLVGCYDPRGDVPVLKGSVWALGGMSGCWRGSYFAPEMNAYVNMLRGQRAASDVPWAAAPLFARLREHHCRGESVPLDVPLDADELGDDVMNAFVPRGCQVKETAEGLAIYDPSTDTHHWYDTFHPDADEPYVRRLLRASGAVGGEDEEMVYEDDNEDGDTVERVSSGVSDIIITGETGGRFAEAWGAFTFLGRVRAWDGLVTLLRTPASAADAHRGRWLFRGYVHDGQWVGRWRETGSSPGSVGYEGAFVVGRAEEAAERW